MKKDRERIIKNYAHDYRDIEFSEEELRELLGRFAIAIEEDLKFDRQFEIEVPLKNVNGKIYTALK
jgi:hypothetical protein